MLQSRLGLLSQILETASLLIKLCLLENICICLLMIRDSEKFSETSNKVTIAAFLG